MLVRAQAGDQRAREEFLKANTRLAASVVNQFNGLDPDDAFQEAMLAMNRALDTFEPSRGYQFSTYAMSRMKYALLSFIRAGRTEGRTPTEAPVALDQELPGGGTASELVGSPDRDIESMADRHAVESALPLLTETHRDVLARVYGLDGHDARTITELGRDMGVSRQYAHQLHSAALKQMRTLLGDVQGA